MNSILLPLLVLAMIMLAVNLFDLNVNMTDQANAKPNIGGVYQSFYNNIKANTPTSYFIRQYANNQVNSDGTLYNFMLWPTTGIHKNFIYIGTVEEDGSFYFRSNYARNTEEKCYGQQLATRQINWISLSIVSLCKKYVKT